jgi:hypothetical protein
MADDVAKRLLRVARTEKERTESVKKAISLGMPLHEIEDLLDYLDATAPLSAPRATRPPNSARTPVGTALGFLWGQR